MKLPYLNDHFRAGMAEPEVIIEMLRNQRPITRCKQEACTVEGKFQGCLSAPQSVSWVAS